METQTYFLPHLQTIKGKSYALSLLSASQPQTKNYILVKNRQLTIGTHPDNDLSLNDPVASRFHAKIELDVFGHKLIDEDSKNGTFVNGLRIVKEIYLAHGCEIQIGTTKFKYEINDKDPIEVQLSKDQQFGQLIGDSPMMRELFAMLAKISPTDLTVLVEGESGTGKELVADAIHQHSPRAKQPFVVFDCSAVPATLIESELFGHLKGAFTGALQDRLGAFQKAEGGTLFLDEIGELPLELQSRLLRALEKKEIKRVGQDDYKKINVRIVAATNRNLAHEVEIGKFRQDLYFRLTMMKLRLPPLRQRKNDIPILIKHFIETFSPLQKIEIGYDTMMKLQKYQWSGNVRELRNFIERAIILSQDHRIETRFLQSDQQTQLGDHQGEKASQLQMDQQADGNIWGDQKTQLSIEDQEAQQVQYEMDLQSLIKQVDHTLPFKEAKEKLVDAFEREYWGELLKKTNDNMSAAARLAGVHRKSVEYLLKKHGIR